MGEKLREIRSKREMMRVKSVWETGVSADLTAGMKRGNGGITMAGILQGRASALRKVGKIFLL